MSEFSYLLFFSRQYPEYSGKLPQHQIYKKISHVAAFCWDVFNNVLRDELGSLEYLISILICQPCFKTDSIY